MIDILTARVLGVGRLLRKMPARKILASRKRMLRNSLKKNIEEKRKPRGENSFVAPHAHFEYQVIYSLLVKMI